MEKDFLTPDVTETMDQAIADSQNITPADDPKLDPILPSQIKQSHPKQRTMTMDDALRTYRLRLDSVETQNKIANGDITTHFWGNLAKGGSDFWAEVKLAPAKFNGAVYRAFNGYMWPDMTEDEAVRLVDAATSYVANQENLRAIIVQSEGGADSVARNLGSGASQVMAYGIVGLLTGGVGIGALAGLQEATDISQEMAQTAMEENDGTLRGYDNRGDAIYSALHGVISGYIETKLGVENLFTGAAKKHLASRVGMQVLKSAAGEGAEEYLQEASKYLFENMAGKNRRTFGEFQKDALTNAVYGAILGGFFGGAMYGVNKLRIQKALKAQGFDDVQSAQMADDMISTAKTSVLNEVDTRAQLRDHYGEQWNNLQTKIVTALENAGWKETHPEIDLQKYAADNADDIVRPLFQFSNKFGIDTRDVLQLADIDVIDNAIYLKPMNLGSPEVIANRIREKQEQVKRLNILSRTGAGNANAKSVLNTQIEVLQKLYEQKTGSRIAATRRTRAAKAAQDAEILATTAPSVSETIAGIDVSQMAVPAQPTAQIRQEMDGQPFVYVGDKQLPVEYKVVPMDEVIASHIGQEINTKYSIKELQNRAQRGSRTDVSVLQSRAAKIQPENLGISYNTQNGAPVVNEKGEVIAGNGRYEVLRMTDQKGRARYNKYLQSLGLNLDGIKDPILVRVLHGLTPAQQIAVADASNVSATSAFDNASQAIQDAKLLKGTNTVTDFMNKIPIESRQGLFLANDRVNKVALDRRYNDAMMAWLFNNDAKVYEELYLMGGITPKVQTALNQSIPQLMALQNEYPDVGLRQDLANALKRLPTVERAKDFAFTISQAEMDDGDSNLFNENALLYAMVFGKNTKTWEGTGAEKVQVGLTLPEFFNYYTQMAVQNQENKGKTDLFGQPIEVERESADMLAETLTKAFPREFEDGVAKNNDMKAVFLTRAQTRRTPGQLSQIDLMDTVQPSLFGDTSTATAVNNLPWTRPVNVTNPIFFNRMPDAKDIEVAKRNGYDAFLLMDKNEKPTMLVMLDGSTVSLKPGAKIPAGKDLYKPGTPKTLYQEDLIDAYQRDMEEIEVTAQVSQDMALRKESNAAWESFANFVKNDFDRFHKETGGMFASFSDMDPNSKYGDMRVIIVDASKIPAQQGLVDGFYSKRTNAIWLPVDKAFLADQDKLQEYLTSNYVKTIFRHEFTHNQDVARGLPEHQPNDTDAEYYNNPAEFNAYSQQAMQDIADSLNKLGSFLSDEALKNWNSFLKYSMQVITDSSDGASKALLNFNDRNKHRFLNRLYKTYLNYKQVLPGQVFYQEDLANENARLDDIYPEYKGETININGKDRTVYNSEGKRIAKSAEALRNFYKWFGDSKAVDGRGRPLVVYHGSYEKNIKAFDKKTFGNNTGNMGMFGQGFYFTDETFIAEDYAGMSEENEEDRGKVYVVYLKIENPLVIDSTQEYGEYGNENSDAALDALKKKKLLGKNEGWTDFYAKIWEDDKPAIFLSQYAKDNGFDGIFGYYASPYFMDHGETRAEFVAFEPTQIKSTENRGTYDVKTPNIFFQSDLADDRNLVVTHGITPHKLKQVLELGGMPVPSIGISRKDSPLDDFGTITLVGTKNMIDPANPANEVYDRDIWSPTTPFVTYKNASMTVGNGFKDRFKSAFVKADNEHTLDEVVYYAENSRRPEQGVNMFKDSRGARLYYVENVLKKKVEIPTYDEGQMRLDRAMVAVRPDQKFIDQIKNIDFNASADEIKDKMDGPIADLIARFDFKKEYGENAARYEEMAKEYYTNEKFGFQQRLNLLSSIKDYVNNKGKMKVDGYKLDETLRNIVESTGYDKYDKWAEKELEQLLGAPKVDVNGKLLDWNLKNITKAMIASGTVNRQESLVYGTGKAIAAGARKFNSIEEIREAGKRLQTKDETKILINGINDAMQKFTDKFMTSSDFTDSMYQKEAAFRALGDVAAKDNITKQTMQDALDYEFGRKEKYSDKLLQEGVDIATSIKTVVRHYFEAKPQRPVRLEEFSGAVIPTSPSFDELAQELENRGLTIARTEDLAEGIQAIEDTVGDIYFQSGYASMRGDLIGGALDADAFEGKGEGSSVWAWGNYLLKSRELDKAHYFDSFDRQGRPSIMYEGQKVGNMFMSDYANKTVLWGLSDEKSKQEILTDLENTLAARKRELDRKDDYVYQRVQNKIPRSKISEILPDVNKLIDLGGVFYTKYPQGSIADDIQKKYEPQGENPEGKRFTQDFLDVVEAVAYAYSGLDHAKSFRDSIKDLEVDIEILKGMDFSKITGLSGFTYKGEPIVKEIREQVAKHLNPEFRKSAFDAASKQAEQIVRDAVIKGKDVGAALQEAATEEEKYVKADADSLKNRLVESGRYNKKQIKVLNDMFEWAKLGGDKALDDKSRLKIHQMIQKGKYAREFEGTEARDMFVDLARESEVELCIGATETGAQKAKALREVANFFKKANQKDFVLKSRASMYKFDVPADKYLLDFTKGLDRQSKYVQKALNKLYEETGIGDRPSMRNVRAINPELPRYRRPQDITDNPDYANLFNIVLEYDKELDSFILDWNDKGLQYAKDKLNSDIDRDERTIQVFKDTLKEKQEDLAKEEKYSDEYLRIEKAIVSTENNISNLEERLEPKRAVKRNADKIPANAKFADYAEVEYEPDYHSKGFDYYKSIERSFDLGGEDMKAVAKSLGALDKYGNIHSQKAASKLLEKYGVKGVKYYGHRDKTGYVTFGRTEPIERLLQGRSVNGLYDPELEVIVLGRNSNTGTLPHEMAHFWANTIFNMVKSGQYNDNIEFMNQAMGMFKMLGVGLNQDALTRDQQEQFATMTEAVIFGMAPIPQGTELPVTAFLNWVPSKYKSILDIGYRDSTGKIVNPVLDKQAVDWFNAWYQNAALPPIEMSPLEAENTNQEQDGRIVPSSAEVMKVRVTEMKADADVLKRAREEQIMEAEEATPISERAGSVGAAVMIESQPGNIELSTPPEEKKRTITSFLIPGRGTNTREGMFDAARDYIASDREHAEEVAFGHPNIVMNDTGIDRGILIRALMEEYDRSDPKYAELYHNLAETVSLAGKTPGLSNDMNFQFYLSAVKQITDGMEGLAAIKYAGTHSLEKARRTFNSDIDAFIQENADKILRANAENKEILVRKMFAEAVMKFKGDETLPLAQEDLRRVRNITTKEAFTDWANREIRKLLKAAPDATMINKIMEESEKAQKAVKYLDSEDYAEMEAAGKTIRGWQMAVKDEQVPDTWVSKLIGSWYPKAMLYNINTHSVNVIGNGINYGITQIAVAAQYKEGNKVPKRVLQQERERLRALYNSSLISVAAMRNPTSPTLLHGEAYNPREGKSALGKLADFSMDWLGKEDNWFRTLAYVDALGHIATADAKKTGQSPTDLFREYKKLNQPKGTRAYEARQEALNIADIAVFQQNGTLARNLKKVRDALNFGDHAGLGTLLGPFVKTPANIVEMGARAIAAPVTSTYHAVKGDWSFQDTVNTGYFVLACILTFALMADYEPPYEVPKRYDPDKPYDSVRIRGTNLWLKLDTFGAASVPLRIIASIATGKGLGLSGSMNEVPLLGDIADTWKQTEGIERDPWKQGFRFAANVGYNRVNTAVPAVLKSTLAAAHLADWDLEEIETGLPKTGIGRKVGRQYGLDGGDTTTNDILRIFFNRLKIAAE